jgi:hypothetical protein
MLSLGEEAVETAVRIELVEEWEKVLRDPIAPVEEDEPLNRNRL